MSQDNQQSPVKTQLHRGRKDVLAALYAYSATSELDSAGKVTELPEGFLDYEGSAALQNADVRVLSISDHILDLKNNPAHLRAVIFVNQPQKEITIAIAGTRLKDGFDKARADIGDNIGLVKGKIPQKFPAAQQINEELLQYLKSEEINIPDYKFNYTGHSLGAVMADCAAADMTLRLGHNHQTEVQKNQVSSVTFDNPGAKMQVETICSNDHTTLGKLIETTSFKAINNRPNSINTLNKQTGEEYTMVPYNQKPLNSFNLMCQYIAKKLAWMPIIGYLAKTYGLGNISTQIKDHSLISFQDVIVTPEDKVKGYFVSKNGKQMFLDEVVTGLEPIKHAPEIFNKIKEQQPEKKEDERKAEYSMTDPKTEERIEFSKEQLGIAVKIIKNSAAKENVQEPYYKRILRERKQAGNKLHQIKENKVQSEEPVPERPVMRTAYEVAEGRSQRQGRSRW